MLRSSIFTRNRSRSANRATGGLGEIRLGIDAAEGRGLEQAVEERCDFSAAFGLRPVMIFATEHHAAKFPFSQIVVQRQQRVI
jgi:hypothetical protein